MIILKQKSKKITILENLPKKEPNLHIYSQDVFLNPATSLHVIDYQSI